MKNQDLISRFVSNRNFEGHTNSLTARNGKLFSYNTCIAQYTGDGRLIINNTRYSVTTSKQQNYLRHAVTASGRELVFVDNVSLNAQRISKE